MNRITLITCMFVSILLSGCSKQETEQNLPAEKTLIIYTSIAPLNFACKQLLSDQDQVLETCPVGEDEPEYIPETDTLVKMINSDLIVLNGASFENWLKTVSIPEPKLLDSSAIYKDEWVEYQGVVHSHGGQADHSHTGYNGHTWTAPAYFQKQCTSVYEKIKTLLTPEEQQQRNLDSRYQELMNKLTALNAAGQKVFTPVKGMTLAASHPTYDYLGLSYGFTVFNIDLPPDAETIDKTIQQTLDTLKQQKEENGVSILFWEEEPNELITKVTTDIGIHNLVYEPLAGMDAPDYITGMMANFERVKSVISQANTQ
jgi:zinc transport system substrate-binding protein